jgi:hypothetical protein
MSWTAQRLSDAPSTAERVTEGAGVLLILLFVAGAIASASSSYGVAGFAVCSAGAAVSAWGTLAGTMQFRYRARLRTRLRESGVRTTGAITETWVIAGSYGAFSALRYRIRTQDGETHTYTAYDQTPLVREWAVGDSIDVLYDADRPGLAIVDDN